MIKMPAFVITVLIAVFTSLYSFAATTSPESFEDTANQLTKAKLKQVPTIIEQLEHYKDRSLPLFEALLNGKLFYQKSDKRLVFAEKNASGTYTLIDALSQQALGESAKKSIKKVRSNNKIRSLLRKAIAQLNLFSDNPQTRINAAKGMLESLNEDNIVLFRQAKGQEKNPEVLETINLGLAIAELDNPDPAAKVSAIQQLSGNLTPIVNNRLKQLAENTEDNSVRNAATQALTKIEGKKQFYGYLETFFFGLSLGSVLLLVASGLAITFGVMGVINMAHGEMIMLGAYTTYVVQLLMPNHIEYSLFVAIPAAFLVSGLVGIAIERGVIRFLKGRPLETLLATFGISLVLQQLVRSVFSPLNRQVSSPEFMSGVLEINPVFSITYNRLYILVFALLVFVVLQLILKKTSLGLNVRAVSQNRDMAKSMGIRTEWVDALTFGLGSGIAGLAGVALSQITNVGPNLGQSYIIDSFMVVVFGGVGNLWGTLVGGFSLGILNKFLEPVTGAVLANIIVLVGIILFIQKRPRGLFPQKGRSAES